MRIVIVGLGIQGRKRAAVAGSEVVATVDPAVPEAAYRTIEQVPVSDYDAALVCVPDAAKPALVRYLLTQRKHVLVEKPLLASDAELAEFETLARAGRVACYTAYNHRFEPHLVRMKALLDADTLGPIYLVRGFYGNGTARDVKLSAWRDQGLGVLPDLGSHLLDLFHWYWAPVTRTFEPWSCNREENRAPDHILFGASGQPAVVLEATLLSWRNTFQWDVIGERGSAHVQGLCKWGPSTFTLRTRVLPSGRPEEQVETLTRPDPTWALEYDHFKQLCRTGGTNLDNDRWVSRIFSDLEQPLTAKATV
ncbi:MAG: Gfo/Idh/MocA family oxidoreductase [Candidatus Omnitrophica bacterium]|nr:Gfo/Idh/MocA family oxidoreductase [Candidatus Omnitrophota bacterium]